MLDPFSPGILDCPEKGLESMKPGLSFRAYLLRLRDGMRLASRAMSNKIMDFIYRKVIARTSVERIKGTQTLEVLFFWLTVLQILRTNTFLPVRP